MDADYGISVLDADTVCDILALPDYGCAVVYNGRLRFRVFRWHLDTLDKRSMAKYTFDSVIFVEKRENSISFAINLC